MPWSFRASSPIGKATIAVTDAAVLGTKVDGVLLVVSAAKTRRDHALRAKEQLERVKVRLVGAVLNNAPPDQSMRGYYAANGDEW